MAVDEILLENGDYLLLETGGNCEYLLLESSTGIPICGSCRSVGTSSFLGPSSIVQGSTLKLICSKAANAQRAEIQSVLTCLKCLVAQGSLAASLGSQSVSFPESSFQPISGSTIVAQSAYAFSLNAVTGPAAIVISAKLNLSGTNAVGQPASVIACGSASLFGGGGQISANQSIVVCGAIFLACDSFGSINQCSLICSVFSFADVDPLAASPASAVCSALSLASSSRNSFSSSITLCGQLQTALSNQIQSPGAVIQSAPTTFFSSSHQAIATSNLICAITINSSTGCAGIQPCLVVGSAFSGTGCLEISTDSSQIYPSSVAMVPSPSFASLQASGVLASLFATSFGLPELISSAIVLSAPYNHAAQSSQAVYASGLICSMISFEAISFSGHAPSSVICSTFRSTQKGHQSGLPSLVISGSLASWSGSNSKTDSSLIVSQITGVGFISAVSILGSGVYLSSFKMHSIQPVTPSSGLLVCSVAALNQSSAQRNSHATVQSVLFVHAPTSFLVGELSVEFVAFTRIIEIEGRFENQIRLGGSMPSNAITGFFENQKSITGKFEMSVANVLVPCYKGESLAFSFNLEECEGTDFDISTWTFRVEFRDEAGSVVFSRSTGFTNTGRKTMQFSISPSELDLDIVAGQSYTLLLWRTNSGFERVLSEGVQKFN